MSFSIKLVGIIGLISSIAGMGYMKAAALRRRAEKLKKISAALSVLREMIYYGNYEIAEILASCFKQCGGITLCGSRAVCKDSDLQSEDARILNDMFSRLGSGEAEAECDRVQMCIGLIDVRLKAAERERDEKCKLWQSGGICIGLAIGIFII